MKKLNLSINTINMIISGVLWVLVAAGLKNVNPDDVAQGITSSIINQAWPFLALIGTNLVTAIVYWARTWKTDKPNFLAFLTSLNFWITIGNIGGSIAMMYGIVLPEDAAIRIADFIRSGDWWNLVTYAIANILKPIFTKVVNTLTEKGRAKVLAGAVK